MINENSIIAVVVLYKCKIEEAKSISSLSDSIDFNNCHPISLVIYDNSPSYNLNKDFSLYKNIYINYIPDENNSGVSKAYNIASRIGVNLGKKYILLLDQDTEIPPNYFYDLSMINVEYSIIVPKLECKGKIISPCKYVLGRGSMLNTIDYREGIQSLKRRNFLNSGSLISISVFNRIGGYDENIPLYFSDFNFFNRIKMIENQYYQMSTTFHHEMSSNDESNLELFQKRFELYCNGATKCFKTYTGKLLMFINVLLRAIKLGLKHRTIIFLKITFIKFFPILFKQ